MTVKEFIKKLQDLPQDYEIVVDGGFSWCSMEYIDFNISDADKTIYME